MHFESIEEVISEEQFLAWYFKTDETKAGAWSNWLLQHQQYVPLVEESIVWLKEHNLHEKDLPASQVERAHNHLQNAIESSPVIKISKKIRWWIPATAAACVLAIAAFLYLNASTGKTTLSNNYGSIGKYQLPDGSEVMLNANSEISFAKSWKPGHSREVWLKGEGFFHVKKTPSKDQFVVHANALDITVTGTKFNVISRVNESSVLLTEGSVILNTADGQQMFLKPGDLARLDHSALQKHPAKMETVLAWMQSKLNFENTPIREVAKIIEEDYGVKVNVSDSATGEKKISGIMPNNNLDVLIEALKATGEYQVNRSGNNITISGL